MPESLDDARVEVREWFRVLAYTAAPEEICDLLAARTIAAAELIFCLATGVAHNDGGDTVISSPPTTIGFVSDHRSVVLTITAKSEH